MQRGCISCAATWAWAGGALRPAAAAASPVDPGAPQEAAPAVADLGGLLEPIRDAHDLPALGGAIVTDQGLVAIGAVGVRRAGGAEPVTVDDRWHVGSCTKGMTATMIARLVERGTLSWETAVAEHLDGDLRPEYGQVTLADLLAHRGGLPSDRSPDAIYARFWTLAGPIEARRAEAAGLSLSVPPAAERGTAMLYSNRGYVVAAAIAEHATGESWEGLMRDLLFIPLGMESAGFGAPGTPGAVDQPRGHTATGDGIRPIEPGPAADNSPLIAPAGGVHCSMADWAAFVALHVRGERSGSNLLSRESFLRLHEPFDGPGERFAMGWAVMIRKWARGAEPSDTGRVLVHDGSNTRWYAVAWIAPERGVGVLAVANCGGQSAARAVDAAASAMIRRHLGLGGEWENARESSEHSGPDVAPDP